MVSLNWIHDFKPNFNYFIYYPIIDQNTTRVTLRMDPVMPDFT